MTLTTNYIIFIPLTNIRGYVKHISLPIFLQCANENLSANDQQEVKGRRRVSPINKCIYQFLQLHGFFLLSLHIWEYVFFYLRNKKKIERKTCVRTSDFITFIHHCRYHCFICFSFHFWQQQCQQERQQNIFILSNRGTE